MNATRRLAEAIDGARLVRFDETAELLLTRHGGHDIHAYDMDGWDVQSWDVGDTAGNPATEEEAVESMQEAITAQDYAV